MPLLIPIQAHLLIANAALFEGNNQRSKAEFKNTQKLFGVKNILH